MVFSTRRSEPVGVNAVGERLGDPATVHHHAEAHVVVVAGHVLVDAAVGEAGECVGALTAGDEGVGTLTHQLQHAVARGEPPLGDRVGVRVPGHQRTPTRTLVNRAGTEGWPVWPTWIGWPLPQLAVPQNTHSSGPPTMSIDAQNRGPMPV